LTDRRLAAQTDWPTLAEKETETSMLKMTSASKPRRSDKRPVIGLAIAGGGPLGRFTSWVPCKHWMRRLTASTCMSSISTSASVPVPFLTASLANHVTATQMSRIFMNSPDAEFNFQP
jgi:NTE family protein